MDYSVVHTADKVSAVPKVLSFFYDMGPWQFLIYVTLFSIVAYVIRKKQKK